MDKNSLFDGLKLRLSQSSGEDVFVSDSELAGIDIGPYLHWACETGFHYYKTNHNKAEPEARLLIELSDKGALGGCAALRLSKLDCVHISAVYTAPALHLRDAHFLTASVQLRRFIKQLQKSSELQALIRGMELSMLISPESEDPKADRSSKSTLWPNAFDNDRYNALCAIEEGTKHTVIVGIADDGIGFLNPRFSRKYKDGLQSRFIAYWDQNSQATESGAAASTGYGQSFQHDCINTLLNDAHLTESSYRKEKQYRLLRGQSHGTGVLDLAAGEEPDVADTTPLVAVQLLLPESGDDNSGGWLDAALLDALRFMLDQVDSWWLQQQDRDLALPKLIVNVSYSSQRGAHDGSCPATRAVDELIAQRTLDNGRQTLAVVYSAGNERQSNTHATVQTLKPNEYTYVYWQLPPDDDTPSFMEIWATGDRPNFSSNLSMANGESCVHINGTGQQSYAKDKQSRVYVSALGGSDSAYNTKTHCSTLLAIAPTQRAQFSDAKAMFGTCRVRIGNISENPLELHCWIQSDKSRIDEQTLGRQSTFVEAPAQPPTQQKNTKDQDGSLFVASKITASNTINALATGTHCLSAGGYSADSGLIAPYSATGKPDRSNGPSIATACQASAYRGLSCSGTHAGSYTTINGTSAAAPLLTRLLAAYFAEHPMANSQAALTALISEHAPLIQALYPHLRDNSENELKRLALPSFKKCRQQNSLHALDI